MHDTQLPTKTARIRLREENYRKVCQTAGLDSQAKQARAFNLAESTVMRVVKGHTAPGPRFITAVLTEFANLGGWTFADLFEVVEEDQRESA